jgi:hypothetical protein
MMYLLNKAGIAMIALVVTIVMNTFEIILADKFDLKATLLKHREQHTNHLNVRRLASLRRRTTP